MIRILCAAIWYDDKNNYKGQPLNIQSGYVVAGLRHNNCMLRIKFYQENRQNKLTFKVF